MHIPVKLTRVIGGGNLRTDEVVGETQALPKVGECFYMTGEGLTGGVRCIQSSEVIQVLDDLFATETGSVYHLELL